MLPLNLTPKVSFEPRFCMIIINGSEAATGDVLQENAFLEISQNSQENTCARVSFLIMLQAEEHLWATVSDGYYTKSKPL